MRIEARMQDENWWEEWIDRFTEKVTALYRQRLRQDLLASLGEPMEIPARREAAAGELSWRRGWNAKRESMLEAINRLLPEEG